MRKLAASVLATAVLAGGSLTGAALAAASPSHPHDHGSSVDRSSSSRHERSPDRSRHDSTSGDRSSYENERGETRDR